MGITNQSRIEWANHDLRTKTGVKSLSIHEWDNWTVPMLMREVEPGVRLIMNTGHISDDHGWKPRPVSKDED